MMYVTKHVIFVFLIFYAGLEFKSFIKIHDKEMISMSVITKDSLSFPLKPHPDKIHPNKDMNPLPLTEQRI